MRSKTLCLLVCLTLCLLELPTCLADAPPPTAPEPYVEPDWFCSKGDIKPVPPAVIPPDRKHGLDCYDKPISVDDFKWNLATSFNEQKEVPKSEHYEVDVHRALLIETGKANEHELEITFTATNKEQCKSVLMKHTEDNGWTVQPLSSGKLSIKMKADRKRVIAVFEPECRLYANRIVWNDQQKLTETVRLHHIFMRNLKTIALPKEVLDITNADNAERGLGGFIVPTDMKEEDNLPDTIKEPNLFYPFHEIKNKYMKEANGKQCIHMCKLGKVFKLTRDTATAASWANTFKLNGLCEWMTIHLNVNNMSQATEISLRHGFVTLPTQVKAYPMDFENMNGEKGYEVIVTFYLKKKSESDSDKDYLSNLIIANRHGRALSATEFPASKDFIIVFSHDKCLTSVIGSDAAGQQLLKYDFNKDLNLAYRVADKTSNIILERFVGRTLDDNEKTEEEKYEYPAKETIFPPFIGKDKEYVIVTKPPRIVETPPTGATYGPNDTAATEAPPPTFHTNNEEMEKLLKLQELQRLAFEKAMNSGNKKYQYWAIPAGFATGSFASFLIANIILFIMKRTVLTFWYKAMYKRYGSDTTMGAGTTMGKTGAGETVGGGTTIGGGTTMGGTTAGETGSTTAA